MDKVIVIVEDEKDIREVIHYNLSREGYQVLSAEDGQKGLDLIKKNSPDLVILDLMLPEVDGLEVCRLLKENAKTKTIPIIMLTAKSEESDVVLGLGLGADDYVTKPFSQKELVARVKSLLRRTHIMIDDYQMSGALKFNGLYINPEAYEVKIDGQVVAMTLTEFKLLHELAQKPNRVFTRDKLMDHVTKENTFIIDRNIDVHILSIRKKLGSYRSLIETVRGVGYRFKLDES